MAYYPPPGPPPYYSRSEHSQRTPEPGPGYGPSQASYNPYGQSTPDLPPRHAYPAGSHSPRPPQPSYNPYDQNEPYIPPGHVYAGTTPSPRPPQPSPGFHDQSAPYLPPRPAYPTGSPSPGPPHSIPGYQQTQHPYGSNPSPRPYQSQPAQPPPQWSNNAALDSKEPLGSGEKAGWSGQVGYEGSAYDPHAYDPHATPPSLTTKDTAQAQREDDAIVAAAMEFARTGPPPPYSAIPRLDKPVAIPQLTHSAAMGFMQSVGTGANLYARAYSPALEPHGISEKDFMGFLDALNTVSTYSGKLQALGLVSGILSFDPSGVMAVASTAVQIGAQAAQGKVFEKRAAAFLIRANTEYFHPRKLHASKCTFDQMRGIAGIPGDVPLLAPVSSQGVGSSIAETRVRAMQPWLAPLNFDHTPPEIQAKGANAKLMKFSNYQLKLQNRQSERSAVGNRLKELSQNPGALTQADVRSIAADVRASGDKSLIKKADKFEKEMMPKVNSVATAPSGDGSTQWGKESKEKKDARRSFWLVVSTWDGAS